MVRRGYTKVLIGRAREMRRAPTSAERKLWGAYLRTLPVRVRRQCPFEGYILDFYVHVHKLVIEADGAVHDTSEARAYDAERTRLLEAAGLSVVRFSNTQVLHDFGGVRAQLDIILRPHEAKVPTTSPPPL